MIAAIVIAGVMLAQADLPNANLPGNAPTLPNSNLPGPVTTDQPLVLPNTDSSGWSVWVTQEWENQAAFQNKLNQFVDKTEQWQQETKDLARQAVDNQQAAQPQQSVPQEQLQSLPQEQLQSLPQSAQPQATPQTQPQSQPQPQLQSLPQPQAQPQQP